MMTMYVKIEILVNPIKQNDILLRRYPEKKHICLKSTILSKQNSKNSLKTRFETVFGQFSFFQKCDNIKLEFQYMMIQMCQFAKSTFKLQDQEYWQELIKKEKLDIDSAKGAQISMLANKIDKSILSFRSPNKPYITFIF